MSLPTKIMIESKYRNQTEYPDVHNFGYDSSQTALWPNLGTGKGAWYDVTISAIIIPYRAAAVSKAYLMVHLKNGGHRAKNNICFGSSQSKVNECNFIVFCEKAVGTSWLIYRSTDIMRMQLDWQDNWIFNIRDHNGDQFVINPSEDQSLPENQVSCHFTIRKVP